MIFIARLKEKKRVSAGWQVAVCSVSHYNSRAKSWSPWENIRQKFYRRSPAFKRLQLQFYQCFIRPHHDLRSLLITELCYSVVYTIIRVVVCGSVMIVEMCRSHFIFHFTLLFLHLSYRCFVSSQVVFHLFSTYFFFHDLTSFQL